MRISDWSSDVCSSDLAEPKGREITRISGNERYTGTDYHRIEGEPGLEILSSGTTGKPKRIRFPYRMLIRMVDMVRVSQMDAKDRKSVVMGKRMSVRVDLGGRGIIKKKKTKTKN